jgi:endonuclease YncB( thermonuclease family)
MTPNRCTCRYLHAKLWEYVLDDTKKFYNSVKSTASWVLGLALALALSAAGAATLSGRVVAVHDGDTVTVLDANRQQYKIRLAGIDAPELKQAFGYRSKQHLSAMVYDRRVTVAWDKHDRYGRIIGKVLVDCRDTNLEQVRAGMAWWYRQYARDQRPEDRRLYEEAGRVAREAKKGLWADARPVPPWEWRRGKRK